MYYSFTAFLTNGEKYIGTSKLFVSIWYNLAMTALIYQFNRRALTIFSAKHYIMQTYCQFEELSETDEFSSLTVMWLCSVFQVIYTRKEQYSPLSHLFVPKQEWCQPVGHILIELDVIELIDEIVVDHFEMIVWVVEIL